MYRWRVQWERNKAQRHRSALPWIYYIGSQWKNQLGSKLYNKKPLFSLVIVIKCIEDSGCSECVLKTSWLFKILFRNIYYYKDYDIHFVFYGSTSTLQEKKARYNWIIMEVTSIKHIWKINKLTLSFEENEYLTDKLFF